MNAGNPAQWMQRYHLPRAEWIRVERDTEARAGRPTCGASRPRVGL